MKPQTTLPHNSDGLFLTDGGLETTLVFHDQLDLPCFAAFPLLDDADGREILRKYYRTHAGIAARHRVGFVLETPTWRANPEWASKLGYSDKMLARANRSAVGLMHEIREEFESPSTPMVLSGCVGPRGDGYRPSTHMSLEQAMEYHLPQIQTFAGAGVDMITGTTINYPAEAAGIAIAAAKCGVPSVISFTVETDGNLPSGQSLQKVVESMDALLPVPPAYYMINCAHPTHFDSILRRGGEWLKRIGGIRANASRCSHAELDEATELDAGDPGDLAERYRELQGLLPGLRVFGGCCGTDHRHIEAVCEKCCAGAISAAA